MKNCLLVFYSRTGLTKKVAKYIASACDCDIEQIHDVMPRDDVIGYLRSGYEALTKKLPPIQFTAKNPADYAMTIVGTPVWAGNISAPMRTYLAQNKGRFNNMASFCTMGSAGKDKADKVLDDIAALAGKAPVAKLAISDEQIEDPRYREKITKFGRSISELGLICTRRVEKRVV